MNETRQYLGEQMLLDAAEDFINQGRQLIRAGAWAEVSTKLVILGGKPDVYDTTRKNIRKRPSDPR